MLTLPRFVRKRQRLHRQVKDQDVMRNEHLRSKLRTRRQATQALAGAAGGVLLVKAGLGARNPLAVAQDDDSGRGRGRGRGRGGDEDNGSSDDPEGPAAGNAAFAQIPAGSIEVRIVGDDASDFVPGELTVDLGQSVTFVNVHSDEHTATGSGFDTGIIPDEGGMATVVLDGAGVFPYACLIHPEMTGVIRVRDENGVVPETSSAAQDIPADATTVVIANLTFDPADITVPTGTTVAWTNSDSVPHTVTSTDGVFDSGIFDPGGSFAFAFNEPGAFTYVCQLHPQMQGTVTAEGDPVASDDQPEQAAIAESATPMPSAASAPDAVAGPSVSIVDFAFAPASLRVTAGATVVWSNDGVAPHTVTGDFADSGVLEPGQTFSNTFETGGNFGYFCAIHPNMTATVEVGAAQAAASTPDVATPPEAALPDGVWLIELVPADDAILAPQQALLAFHADGMLEADFTAASGDGIPTNLLASGHGEWVVRDGLWRFALAVLADEGDRRSTALASIDAEGRLSTDGLTLEGTFTVAVVSADGQSPRQGSGTFSGQPLPLDP